MYSDDSTPNAHKQAAPSDAALPVEMVKPTAPEAVPANNNAMNNMTIAKARNNQEAPGPDRVIFTIPDRRKSSELDKSEGQSHPSDCPHCRNQGGANKSDKVIFQIPQSLPSMTITGPRINPVDRSVVKPEQLGETADFIDCPYCRERSRTKVEKTNSGETQLAAAFCCLFCGVITVFIPLCFHWCSHIEHRCENCHQLVARQPHNGHMEAVRPSQPAVSMREESKQVPMSRAMVDNMERPN